MKICVVGAGAIGGFLAVKLAQTGHQLSVIMRGANLATVKTHGMRLILEDGQEVHTQEIFATDVIAEVGVQDLIILTLKAHQVAAIAEQLCAIMDTHTRIITMQNGIPWWYFHNLPEGMAEQYRGRQILAADPDGRIFQHIPVSAVIGSVVYPACEMLQPGVIKVIEGKRFTLGELDGSDTASLREISDAFRNAGFKAPVSSDIRGEIWLKLWGNLSFNPISALTHATLEDICLHPESRQLAYEMMTEAKNIAEKLGIEFKISLEKRIAGAQAVGQHKTSMLQDVEMGRELELQSLVATVIELGEITEIPTPQIRAVYALSSLLAQQIKRVNGKLKL